MNSTQGSPEGRGGGRSWRAAAAALSLLFLSLSALAVVGQDPTLDERFYFGVGRRIILSGEWEGRGALLHPPLGYYVSSLPLLAFADPSVWQPWPLLLSRLASLVLFGLPLLAVTYAWARGRDGPVAGVMALALVAGSPTLRAHAALVTPDWPLTATSLGALFLFWRAELRGGGPRRGRPYAWGAVLGLSLLAKGSAWLLVACVAGFSTLSAMRERSPAPLRRLALGLAAAWLVLQAGYGFAGWLDTEGKAALLARVPDAPGPRIAAGMAAALFPLPYLRSMATQLHVARQGVPAFLMGELSNDGFPHYFLVALLVKLTLPCLLLLAAAFLWLRRTRRDGDLVLLLPAFVLLTAFSLGRVQIGVRYLLPIFPLLFVHASRLAGLVSARSRAASLALATVVVLHLISGLRAWPDDIAYFNELAGGPANGWRWLIDSNLDWGQNRTRMEQEARRQGWLVEPPLLPETGRVVVGVNRLLGPGDRARYRRLREEFEPVGHVGYNFLVFDLSERERSASVAVTVVSGDGWEVVEGGAGAAWLLEQAPLGFDPWQAYPGTGARLMACAEGESRCRLAHRFVLASPPRRAVLHLAARDAVELRANGRLALSKPCTTTFERLELGIANKLRAGDNSLTVKLTSCGWPPSGVFLEMRVIQEPAAP